MYGHFTFFLKKNYYFKGTSQIRELVGKKKKKKRTVEESDKNKRKKKKKSGMKKKNPKTT